MLPARCLSSASPPFRHPRNQGCRGPRAMWFVSDPLVLLLGVQA